MKCGTKCRVELSAIWNKVPHYISLWWRPPLESTGATSRIPHLPDTVLLIDPHKWFIMVILYTGQTVIINHSTYFGARGNWWFQYVRLHNGSMLQLIFRIHLKPQGPVGVNWHPWPDPFLLLLRLSGRFWEPATNVPRLLSRVCTGPIMNLIQLISVSFQ